MQAPEQIAQEFQRFVDNSYWQTASSELYRTKYPHQYSLKKWAKDNDAYESAVRMIRSYGVPGKFYRRIFPYLYVGDYKYWTMNDPLNEVTIINRGKPDVSYGKQDAPEPAQQTGLIYDALAPDYDLRYVSDVCQTENQQVVNAIGDGIHKKILDIGCGTGLLLDLADIPQHRYLGLDPSQGMVNEFLRKHPEYNVFAIPFSEYKGRRFELAVAMYGVGSYLSIEDIEQLPEVADSWFVMFYKPGYAPDYYNGVRPWEPEHDTKVETMLSWGNTRTFDITNYCVVAGG